MLRKLKEALISLQHEDESLVSTKSTGDRPLNTIARDISFDWKNVNYAAKPYLDAMGDLNKITDMYGMDSGSSVVAYFLANAQSWHGEKAKAIKKELNVMLKKHYAHSK